MLTIFPLFMKIVSPFSIFSFANRPFPVMPPSLIFVFGDIYDFIADMSLKHDRLYIKLLLRVIKFCSWGVAFMKTFK